MILKKELELFKKWSKVRDGFSPDGISNEEAYLNSKLKLLFILKEVNDKEGTGVDMKDFLYHGAYGRHQTWENITRWIYGINNINKHIHWKEIKNRQFFNKYCSLLLPTISAINLKKSPGGHTTVPAELVKIANDDKDFLNLQFKLYFDNNNITPDIIIACGENVSNIFHNLIEMKDTPCWLMTSRGVYYYEYKKGKYFIKYAHPEARVSNNILYYGLIDSIREILQNNPLL